MTVVKRLSQGDADILSLVLAAHRQGKVEITEVEVNRNVVTGPTWEMHLERWFVSADYGMLVCEPQQQRPAMLWLMTAYKKLCDYVVAQRPPPPSYHDLYLTTETIDRTALKDLPFGVRVICTRAGGWEVWHSERPPAPPVLIAAEYAKAPISGLRLDVAGHVIVDSLTPDQETTDDEEHAMDARLR